MANQMNKKHAKSRGSNEICVATRSGRISKPVKKENMQNCIMDFAKMKKCRDRKKKQEKIQSTMLRK